MELEDAPDSKSGGAPNSVRVRIPPPALPFCKPGSQRWKGELMIKKEIVERVAKNTGLNKVIVKRIVDEFLKILSDCFVNKERVELRNFGVFYFKNTRPKKARNPKTGEEVIIPQRMKIIFKPSRKLR